MAWYSVVVIVMLVQQAAAQEFNPDLTVVCSAEPVYTFTLTEQSPDGAIFIDGICAQKATTNGDLIYTFAESDCTGTLPPLGTSFKVRVLEFDTFGLGNDGVFTVTCSTEERTVEKVLDIEASDDDSVEKTGTPVTPELEDQTFVEDSEAATGVVGQSAQIKFILSVADRVEYGTRFESATATKTNFDGTVPLITGGCTVNADVVTQPVVSDAGTGELVLNLILFIPINTASTTPFVAATTVTLTFQITICPGACEAADCSGGGGGSRRRRRADDNNSTVLQTMEYAKTFTVYPTGQKKRQREEITKTGTAIDSSVCLERASFYGVISALLLVLVVCVAISACMFYRLRKGPVHKGSDTSYNNKAFY